ncbi:MAG: hypothetical protein SGPRY_004253, partial [Prymnesium sp.]
MASSQRDQLARGSVVWAKIFGLPWWPAQIRSLRTLDEEEPTVRVRFFVTQESRPIAVENLEHWSERIPQAPEDLLQIKSKRVRRQYQAAVDEAMRVEASSCSAPPVDEQWSSDETDLEEEMEQEEVVHRQEDSLAAAADAMGVEDTTNCSDASPEIESDLVDEAERELDSHGQDDSLIAAVDTMELEGMTNENRHASPQVPATADTSLKRTLVKDASSPAMKVCSKGKRRKSPTKDELCLRYHRGSLVWAKVHGFPWWPSQVRSNKAIHDADPRVRIRFFYSSDDAMLPLNKVLLWSDRQPDDPSNMKIKSKAVIKQYAEALRCAYSAIKDDAHEETWSDDQENEKEKDFSQDAMPRSPEEELQKLRLRTIKRPKGARPLYAHGSLVWAKIHGLPWWPSEVVCIRELFEATPVVGVRFCYTGQKETLALEQLRPWEAREAEDPSEMNIVMTTLKTIQYRKAWHEARAKAAMAGSTNDEDAWNDEDNLLHETSEIGSMEEQADPLPSRADEHNTPALPKSRVHSKASSNERPYKRGEVVWGKVYGFPWWPSHVRSTKEINANDPRVRVRFCFTNDNVTLPLDKLCAWEDRVPADPSKMTIKSKVRVISSL